MAPSPIPRPAQRPATDRLARALLRAERLHGADLGAGPLVIAVSGGADSLALLLATHAVQHAIERDLVVAHFSHGIRKTAERREATLVRRVAKELGLDVAHERASVPPSEAAAREARYEFFAKVCRSAGAAAVVTAHTRDDQAETLLLRLTRGTGLRGAGAIRELSLRQVGSSKLTLLRPLLSIARTDTVATCAENGVRPALDGTNRYLKYARNRMRHRVLRELEEVNPSARDALSRFAMAAQADDDLLQEMADAAVREVERRSAGLVSWPATVMRDIPTPLFVRVLQRGWATIAGEGAALSQAQIDSSVDLVREPGGGTLDLGDGARLVVEQSSVRLTRHDDPPPLPTTRLAVPGKTTAGGWVIETSITQNADVVEADPRHASMDLDQLGEGLIVRSREPGDRLQPLGMAEAVSLQDLLVNAKVPRGDRDSLPLIVGARGIAWVAGVRIADWARVTGETRRVCQMRVRRVSDQ